MNLAETLLAARRADAVAIQYRQQSLTYHEMRTQVEQLAQDLLSLGHPVQSRIGLCAENSPFYIIAYLAIIRAGHVAVPLPTDLDQNTFLRVVKDASIPAFFVSDRLAVRLQPLAKQASIPLLTEAILDHTPPAAPLALPSIDPCRDLAAIMYTSGSTGTPKGVMQTHHNIHTNTCDIIAYLGLNQDDRAMQILPLHYCFGASILHTHLSVGASIVINNDFKLFPELVLQEMEERQCTGLAGVPSTYQILLRKTRFPQTPLPHLRWLQQAGGKLPDPYITQLRNAHPQAQLYIMYGQTEATARLSYLPPEHLSTKLGSIGKGLGSTKLEVLRTDNSPVTPGSHEVGEIVATGPNISPGYWNDPSETAKYFKDGRLHTGDLATVDADGFITIVERERDMIKSGGNRVSPKEIENTLAELPQVIEVAVVGIPHTLLGEGIQAHIVLREKTDLSANEILAHCRARLPSYKIPHKITLAKALPHNAAGKILKQKLRYGNSEPVPQTS